MTTSHSRRIFIKATAGLGLASGFKSGQVDPLDGSSAGAARGAAAPSASPGLNGSTGFPITRVAHVGDLAKGGTLSFSYPDAASPCIMIRADAAVPFGIGPNNDITAYSSLCTHMGCGVHYDATSQTLKCPCHFSVFDPCNAGQMVCGQATRDLPRVLLQLDSDTGEIFATAIDGLLYGRVSNLL